MRLKDLLLWYGSESSAQDIMQMESRAYRMLEKDSDLVKKYASRPGADQRFGPYSDQIQVLGDLAIVPIEGSMQGKESWITNMMGIMTYDSISNIMATLVDDGNIRRVLLDIDSPGGQVKNLSTALEGISAARDSGIEIIAHTSGDMNSAAYWIGSAADYVAASETAEVGSVGVIAVHMEQAEALEKDGIGVTVLRKGEEKALSTPYEKLSDKARKQILASMDKSYKQFISGVSENRGIPENTVEEKIATGAVFDSAEALELGMVDEIVTYNELVSRYVDTSTVAQQSQGEGSQQWSKAAMHKKPITQAGKISQEDAAIAVAAGASPEEAQALIAQSEEEDPNAPEELAEVTVTEEESSVEGVEQSAEAPAATKDETPSNELGAFQSMVAALNEQLVESRVQVSKLESELTALKSGNAGLRQIALEQTQRLRISLGQPGDTADLEALSDVALVQSHRQTLEGFMSRFNVGAKSKESESDNTPEESVTRMSAAASRLTRIK